jgi:hypothetical protein
MPTLGPYDLEWFADSIKCPINYIVAESFDVVNTYLLTATSQNAMYLLID